MKRISGFAERFLEVNVQGCIFSPWNKVSVVFDAFAGHRAFLGAFDEPEQGQHAIAENYVVLYCVIASPTRGTLRKMQEKDFWGFVLAKIAYPALFEGRECDLCNCSVDM
jgi:hypothetical protein